MKLFVLYLTLMVWSILIPAYEVITNLSDKSKISGSFRSIVADNDLKRVQYKGDHIKIKKAVAAANEVLKNPQFYERIANKGDFDYTSEKSTDIANWIKHSRVSVRVKLYNGETGSGTNAYVSPKHPYTIFLNRNKLNRSIGSIAGTLIHETVHSVDRSLKNHRFGHRGNSRNGKENSAPYWIAGLARCIIESGENCDNKVKSYIGFEDIDNVGGKPWEK